MATAPSHCNVPKPFSSGDAAEWLQRFKLCSTANGWMEETKVVKLPTLLEGEALAVWLDLNADERKTYDVAKKRLIETLMPMGFTMLNRFQTRQLQSGEPCWCSVMTFTSYWRSNARDRQQDTRLIATASVCSKSTYIH